MTEHVYYAQSVSEEHDHHGYYGHHGPAVQAPY